MTSLTAALEANSLPDVLAALEEIFDKYSYYSIAESDLQVAIGNKNAEILGALLEARERLQILPIYASPPPALAAYQQKDRMKTLEKAIRTDDVQIARMLIDAGYEPFPAGKETALHFAAIKCERVEANTFMLEYIWEVASSRGISINVPDEKGNTPLHVAGQFLSCPSAFRFLFQHGASLSVLNNVGYTPFSWFLFGDYTTEFGHSDQVRTISQLFVEAGLNIQQFTSTKYFDDDDEEFDCDTTPLMEAAYHEIVQAVKVLLAAGANVHAVNPQDQKSVLHWSLEGGGSKCARLILAAGADPNARDIYGKTVLHRFPHLFFHDGIADGIHLSFSDLAGHGADFNVKDKRGQTPLHIACKKLDEGSVIDSLLEYGADPTIVAQRNLNCLHLATENFPGNLPSTLGVKKLILKHGKDMQTTLYVT